MFRVISANVNGIRAAARKGFFEWLPKQRADVICIQETKAQIHNLSDDIFCPNGYHCFYNDAEKKGYSGVALYTKKEPKKIITSLGFDIADTEGRYLQADFDDLRVASIYLPSGSSGEERQQRKFEFMDIYLDILKKQKRAKKPMIICGDWNIVHKEIDIKNFKSNQKNSGCLPEEREWIDQLFTKYGFIDAFREVNQNPHQYTWWSNRGRARENNVGWRIDYQILTPNLKNTAKKVRIYKDTWFSDHAPLIIDYDL